jgi:hypothetical protein
MPLKSATCGRELEAGLRRRPGSNNVTFDGKPPDGVFVMHSPVRRDGERLRGKIAFPELPNGIDDRRLANPTPCGIRKNKDQLFRSQNAESLTEHPAFAKQSSLVDETGIEPATSSLRTKRQRLFSGWLRVPHFASDTRLEPCPSVA